jgi:hypothetical protein
VKLRFMFLVLSIMRYLCGGELPSSLTVSSISLRITDATDPILYSPSSFVMITNRARTLGDQVNASGTRYFSVKSADLQGMTSEQVARRLAPPEVKATDGVRSMDILVDIERPVTARSSGPAYVGTALVDAATRQISVQSTIIANGLRVIGK